MTEEKPTSSVTDEVSEEIPAVDAPRSVEEVECVKCGHVIKIEEFVRFIKCPKCSHRNKVEYGEEPEKAKTIGYHFGMPVEGMSAFEK